MSPPWFHFLVLLAIFAFFYFGITLPLFQRFSKARRGRRFVIRLGTPWQFGNPEHRWDVLMSALSFLLALGVSMFTLDYFFPLEAAGR